MAFLDVVFRVLDKAGQAFIEPRREDGHGATYENPTNVTDYYKNIEILGRQLGNDNVLVFTFSQPVKLVVVHSVDHQNHMGSVAFNGINPSETAGIPLIPGAPISFPVEATEVRVYERSGGEVTVYGYY